MDAFVKESWKIVRRKFNMPIVQFLISIVLTIADCCFIVSTLCLSLHLLFAKYLINFVIAFFGFSRKDVSSNADQATDPLEDQGSEEITTPEKNPFAPAGRNTTPPASGIELMDMISEKPCDQLREIEKFSTDSIEATLERNVQDTSSLIELKAIHNQRKGEKNGVEDSEAGKIKRHAELKTIAEEIEVIDSIEIIENVKERERKTFSNVIRERSDVADCDRTENKEVKAVQNLVFDDVEKRDTPKSAAEAEEERGFSKIADEKVKENAPKTMIKEVQERVAPKVMTEEVGDRGDSKVATEEDGDRGDQKVATEEVMDKGYQKVATKEFEERSKPKIDLEDVKKREVPKIVIEDVEKRDPTKSVADAEKERGISKTANEKVKENVLKTTIKEVEERGATKAVTMEVEERGVPKVATKEFENGGKTKIVFEDMEVRKTLKTVIEHEEKRDASKSAAVVVEEKSTVEAVTDAMNERGTSETAIEKVKGSIPKTTINEEEERSGQMAATKDVEEILEKKLLTDDGEKRDTSKQEIEIIKKSAPQVVTKEVQGGSFPMVATPKMEERGTSEAMEIEKGISMLVIKNNEEKDNLQPVTQKLGSISVIKDDKRSDSMHNTKETEERVSSQGLPKKADERDVLKVMGKEEEKISVSKQEINEAQKCTSVTKGVPKKTTIKLEKGDDLVSKSVIKDGGESCRTSVPMTVEVDKSSVTLEAERVNETRAIEKKEESISKPVTGKVEDNVTLQPSMTKTEEVAFMPVVKEIKNISAPVPDTKGTFKSVSEGVFERSTSKTVHEGAFRTGGLMSVMEGAFGTRLLMPMTEGDFGRGVLKCQTLGAFERGTLKSTSEGAVGRGILKSTSEGAVGRGILKSTSEGAIGRGILKYTSEGALEKGILKSTSEGALKEKISKQADEVSEKDFEEVAERKHDRAEDADCNLKSRNVTSKKSKGVKWEDTSVKSDSKKDSSKKFKKNK